MCFYRAQLQRKSASWRNWIREKKGPLPVTPSCFNACHLNIPIWGAWPTGYSGDPSQKVNTVPTTTQRLAPHSPKHTDYNITQQLFTTAGKECSGRTYIFMRLHKYSLEGDTTGVIEKFIKRMRERCGKINGTDHKVMQDYLSKLKLLCYHYK